MDTAGTIRDVDFVDGDQMRLHDEDAREFVRAATTEVGSLVRSTLGPYGLETLVRTRDLHDEPETVLTSDADQILSALERGDGFNHPVAAIFVDCVDSVRRALHDGTGTTVVLADELVRNGLDLVAEGAHPSAVAVGYAMAANRAGRTLDALARPVDPTDRTMLASIAETTMTTELDGSTQRRYGDLVATVVSSLATETDDHWFDVDDVGVVAGVDVPDTLRRGVVLRRHPSAAEREEDISDEFDWTPAVEGTIRDATVAVVDDEITFGETASSLEDPTVTVDAYREEATALARRRVAFAERVAEMGVDVFVCEERLDDDLAAALSRSGVAVVDKAQYPRSDLYRLARATGASVVSHPDDLTPATLGVAGRVHEVVRNDEKWAIFEECDGPVFTVTVGADTASGVAEREHLVDDAVRVAAIAAIDRQALPGAGAPAAAVASDLRTFARSISGREQLAVEAFAESLEAVPAALARNAGLDSLDSIVRLRSAHAADRDTGEDDPRSVGLDLDTGRPVDAWEVGVVEPRRVFSQAIETARVAAEQLLTVDCVVLPDHDADSLALRTEHE